MHIVAEFRIGDARAEVIDRPADIGFEQVEDFGRGGRELRALRSLSRKIVGCEQVAKVAVGLGAVSRR